MSAIAAVVSADGREHLDATAAMLRAAAHRARGAARTWHTGPVVLGWRAAAGSDCLPFVRSPRGDAIVFDGRLDNRADLAATLGTSNDASDAGLVLAAYERWRDDAPVALLGDFAFAIWDASAGRLFCARDVFGQRPLFYGRAGQVIAIGSEPQQVLAHSAIPGVINEAVIAEHLTGMPTTVDETVWQSVKRLPPAHALSVSSAAAGVHRYWDFDPDARVEHARPEAYSEHFADLFETAVACRVRGASRGVGVFLSGGLDSSAVAAVAARLHRNGDAPAAHAFSITFPNASCDETPYIDAVVQHAGLRSARLEAVAPARCRIDAEVARYRDLPAFPNGFLLDPLRARAAADVDVVLTGYGGDEWFGGTRPVHIADVMAPGGRPRAALTRALLAPLIPRRVKPLARAIAGGPRPTFDWIRPEFAARTALRDRLRRPRPAPFRTRLQRAMHAITTSAVQVIGDELEDRAAAFAGIDQRQPFNDRRVAEFGFALPDPQRWSGNDTKVVIRRALAGDLPEAVLRRRGKAEFSSTFVEAMERLGARRLFDDLLTARAGWVDADAAAERYDRLLDLYRREDAAYISLTGSIWAIVAVELWLRHVEGVKR